MAEPHPSQLDSRTIDGEHQVQVRLMQALVSETGRGASAQELFTQLAEYSRAHFLSEELLMRLYAYPDYDDHVLDHERMTEWLDEMAARQGEPEALRRAARELMGFFLRHIDTRDRKLHDFLGALPGEAGQEGI